QPRASQLAVAVLGGPDVSGFAAFCLYTRPASARRVAGHRPYGAEHGRDRFYVRILMGTAHGQCYVRTHRRWPRVIVAVAMSHVPAWLAEGVAMQPGVGRVLTTHSGSLPRPGRFLSLVLAREAGESVDEAQFTDEVRAAVRETVRMQADAGVDVLNDGEMGKPSYATYVKDRLTGFGGQGSIEQVAASVMAQEDFPDFAEKQAQTVASAATIRFTTCDGPVQYVGQAAVKSDIDILKAATDGVRSAGVFMSAASPGVIAVFSPNRYYGSQEEYLGTLAEAMRQEYEAIHRAGLVLQLDCPDLAMTAPGAGSLENFRAQMELNIEALNHALANIPAEAARIHICWGNGEFPRTSDVELKDIIDIVLKAKPAGLMLMASNGRHAHEWKVFQDIKLPDGKYVIPGVLDSTTNIVEHPEVVADRLIRYAEVVGR